LDHRTFYIVDSFGGSPHSHYGLMGETRNNLSRCYYAEFHASKWPELEVMR